MEREQILTEGWWRWAVNLRQTMYKLQTALCQKGVYIKINQKQHFSEKAGRMVTKYVLQEKQTHNGKMKNVTLLETYQQAEVVKALAEMYGGG